jgi:hypothetical protein
MNKRALFAILIIFAATEFLSAQAFTDSFPMQQCSFSSTGKNPFMILEPGYQLTLEGVDEGENVRLTITVLNETKVIDGIETRVVKEREVVGGELSEISKNYFAICKKNNSVFYFGEDVDFYENGMVVNHEGSWRHGVNGAHAGLQMPGIVLLGSRYFQEVAPDVAMDRAQIIGVNTTYSTPAGTFTNCLRVKESTPLEPDVVEFKTYAPGIGLISDNDQLKLVNVTTVAGPE